MQVQKNDPIINGNYPIVNGTAILKKEQDASGNNDADAIDPQDEDANISAQEADILNSAGDGQNQDDISQDNAQLDTTDEEGDLLNEGNDYDANDLDVPGADLDDADELIGEEDEENNSYSESKQDDTING